MNSPNSMPMPPERENQYLANAKEVIGEASEDYYAKLGEQVVAGAEELTRLDAQAVYLPDEVQNYVQEHDLSEGLTDEISALEHTETNGIAAGAEEHLDPSLHFKRVTAKHHDRAIGWTGGWYSNDAAQMRGLGGDQNTDPS